MVGDRSLWLSGSEGDHGPVRPLPTILSTSLWKSLGIPGLTCPQAATYRGSVGVEPAVSCCAPCWTTLVPEWRVQDCTRGRSISGSVDHCDLE